MYHFDSFNQQHHAVQVVEEAQRRAGETLEKTQFEKREALEAEMPGYKGIKHHITQDEVSRRRLSLHQNSIRVGDLDLGTGVASGVTPNGGTSAGTAAVFSAVGNRSQDRMERGARASGAGD